MKFKIGQMVGVTDAINECRHLLRDCDLMGWRYPVQGRTYTIRGGSEVLPGHNGYLLEEIVNPRFPFPTGVTELHFSEELFAPLHDTAAEVEALRRLSNPESWTDDDRLRYVGDPRVVEREVA